MENQSRPVTGYPAGAYPPPQSGPNGYPYPAPPQYYNPNPHYMPPYSNPRAIFIRRFIAIMIGCFIITGTVVFIIWLVLRPRLPEFQVDSVSVSNFTVSSSSSQVSGNWDFRFSVRNPNKKMSIYYDRIESFLTYKFQSLSKTTLPPIDQDTRNLTVVTASFFARGNYVEGWVVDDINKDRTSGSVGFDVGLRARVRFGTGAWKARRRLLRVLCEEVKVGLSSNGTAASLLGGSRECRVGL